MSEYQEFGGQMLAHLQVRGTFIDDDNRLWFQKRYLGRHPDYRFEGDYGTLDEIPDVRYILSHNLEKNGISLKVVTLDNHVFYIFIDGDKYMSIDEGNISLTIQKTGCSTDELILEESGELRSVLYDKVLLYNVEDIRVGGKDEFKTSFISNIEENHIIIFL